MKMNTRKTRLAVAVAGVVGLSSIAAQAADFNASTTLQNTLTVVSLQDFDLGTVFASSAGTALTDGVGAIQIEPDGTTTDVSASAISLISLGTPVPAQGSVDMAAPFTLTLPATNTVAAADFAADAGASLTNITTVGAALEHESANPDVPDLYLIHFTVADVSGGTRADETAAFDGDFVVTPEFGETTYVFNIGATLTTAPAAAVGSETYQEGIYAGTFEVTASY